MPKAKVALLSWWRTHSCPGLRLALLVNRFCRISKESQKTLRYKKQRPALKIFPKPAFMPLIFLFPQAGGYLAEPKHIDQMEFLNALAGLQADFTGIKYDFSKRSTE